MNIRVRASVPSTLLPRYLAASLFWFALMGAFAIAITIQAVPGELGVAAVMALAVVHGLAIAATLMRWRRTRGGLAYIVAKPVAGGIRLHATEAAMWWDMGLTTRTVVFAGGEAWLYEQLPRSTVTFYIGPQPTIYRLIHAHGTAGFPVHGRLTAADLAPLVSALAAQGTSLAVLLTPPAGAPPVDLGEVALGASASAPLSRAVGHATVEALASPDGENASSTVSLARGLPPTAAWAPMRPVTLGVSADVNPPFALSALGTAELSSRATAVRWVAPDGDVIAVAAVPGGFTAMRLWGAQFPTHTAFTVQCIDRGVTS